MRRALWLWATIGLFGCGGGGGTGTAVLFSGTCLESLFRCFGATGNGTCGYDAGSQRATLTFSNGARIESDSNGTQPNRVFGASGSICFTMTRINSTTRNYSGQGVDATLIDQAANMLELRCPGAAATLVAAPAQNPAETDLSACAP